MPAWFNLELDTTAPATPEIHLQGDAAVWTSLNVDAEILTGDLATAGYQMKIWGDVDPAWSGTIQTLEADSAWIPFQATVALKLASEGNNNVYLKLRDDVWNETAVVSDAIVIDSALPVIEITAGPAAHGETGDKISKVDGKRIATLEFQSDSDLVEWFVGLVTAETDTHSMATEIPQTNGSTTRGGVLAGIAQQPVSIDGRDLNLITADGTWIVKVFGKDQLDRWSV